MKDSSKDAPTKKYLSLLCSWEALNWVVVHPRTHQNYSPCRRRDQREPVMYFSVASTSFTDGFEGSLLERMKEMTPLALQPCVWNLECCTSSGWPLSISRRKEPYLSLTIAGVECNCLGNQIYSFSWKDFEHLKQ